MKKTEIQLLDTECTAEWIRIKELRKINNIQRYDMYAAGVVLWILLMIFGVGYIVTR